MRILFYLLFGIIMMPKTKDVEGIWVESVLDLMGHALKYICTFRFPKAKGYIGQAEDHISRARHNGEDVEKVLPSLACFAMIVGHKLTIFHA